MRDISTSSQVVKATQLVALLKKKMDIEEQMALSVKGLHKAYDTMNREFECIIAGRLEEMSEAENAA